jgi:hypothetical protein
MIKKYFDLITGYIADNYLYLLRIFIIVAFFVAIISWFLS